MWSFNKPKSHVTLIEFENTNESQPEVICWSNFNP